MERENESARKDKREKKRKAITLKGKKATLHKQVGRQRLKIPIVLLCCSVLSGMITLLGFKPMSLSHSLLRL